MKSHHKTVTFWLVTLLVLLLFVKFYSEQQESNRRLTYSEFIRAVENNEVESVTFKGKDSISGVFKPSSRQSGNFSTNGNTGDATFDILRSNGITPDYEPDSEGSFLSMLAANLLPLLVLLFIFIYFFKQIQISGGKALSFGKSRARMLRPEAKKITFADVSGVEEAKAELYEIVDFLKSSKKYTALGGKIPRGVMLVGEPGTGKTLLARAVAGEANVPFFSISGSDFVEMFVGVGASRVRDLFEQGKKNAPCIIFIDEIDAVGRHRGSGLGGGHDEREQTLNQLLVEMDGFESNDEVILIAATNRIDVLDPALLRPGRFDRRVVVPTPDVKGRLGILKVHTKNTPLAENVDLEIVARGTPGFTGADIANLVNEAALYAARNDKTALDANDFDLAKDKVLMGPERKSMVLTEDAKRITAYHEAGHTLVALNLPEVDPIHKVSIIPRGQALGITMVLPKDDILNYTKTRATNYISFALGGRCAEELIFNEISSGAANDIQQITKIAHSMVCQWGMSDLGPIKFQKSSISPFASPLEHIDYSEETAKSIDTQVSKIITDCYNIAKDILTKQRDTLDRLATALMNWETLDESQVKKIVDGEDLGTYNLENGK